MVAAGAPSFWQFLCGQAPKIIVRAQQLPIPPEFSEGDYAADPVFRMRFQQWLTDLWERKDQQIGMLLQQG